MPRISYSNPAVDSAVRSLDKEFADSFRSIRAWLEKQLAKLNRDGKILVNDTENARNIRKLLSRLKLEARNAGFGDIIKRQADELMALSRDVLREARAAGVRPKFNKLTGENVKNLVWGEQRALLVQEQELSRDLERIIMRANLGSVTWGDITKSIATQMQRSERVARITASDALASFHTQTRVMHFEDRDAKGNIQGVKWWLYDGPNDERTRPFCAAFVGRRVTVEMLNSHATDYGRAHPLPPSVSLGGYNCRHELVPLVTKDSVKKYKKGPR